MKSIEERAKDLCSDISNILIHHYDGYGTELAEAKAVEDAEELINTIREEMIEKVDKYMKENTHQHFVFFSNNGWKTRDKFIDDLKSFLEE